MQFDGGSLEILAVGESERALHAGGLRVVPRDPDTKAVIYNSRADVFAVSVESGEITVLRPNGKEVRTVEAGSMATFANTRDDIRINKTDAALEIGAVQAVQLKHLGKLGKLNSAIGEKAELLLGALAAASGGLIGGGGGIPGAGIPSGGLASASPGDSAGGDVSSMGSQPMVATDGMNSRFFDAGTTTGAPTTANPGEMPAWLTRLGNQTGQVRNQVGTTVWRGTRCGTNCRFGIPIVTTHIFFFPVVGGIIRPFCQRFVYSRGQS